MPFDTACQMPAYGIVYSNCFIFILCLNHEYIRGPSMLAVVRDSMLRGARVFLQSQARYSSDIGSLFAVFRIVSGFLCRLGMTAQRCIRD